KIIGRAVLLLSFAMRGRGRFCQKMISYFIPVVYKYKHANRGNKEEKTCGGLVNHAPRTS
ncbi:MAG: hypothetical protein U1D97_11640, partial [Desulfuromonadales bacterium]|nr:hypothetical protein [Desulfuromonadales bacterium]